jgi:stage IV sporulation protein FB
MRLRFELRHSAIVLVVVLLALSIARLGVQDGTMAAVLIVLSLLAHESGHILMAACLGVQVKAIGLCALGAFIRREDSHRFGAEAAIALAGPMVNLILAILLIGPTPLASFIATMNAYIFLANLLPIPGCDGWRAMHSLWQVCFSRP